MPKLFFTLVLAALGFPIALPCFAQDHWKNECVIMVNREATAESVPLLYLPPESEIVLISMMLGTPQETWVGFADYIGEHELFHLGLPAYFDIEPTHIVYAGEVKLRNRLTVPALGKVEEINVTTGYIKRNLKELRQNGMTVINSPDAYLERLRITRPDLVSDHPVIHRTFAAKPHLLGEDPGDIRHGYTAYLMALSKLAKDKKELGPQLWDTVGHPADTHEILRKTEWIVPHVRRRLDRDPHYCGDLAELLKRWQADRRALSEPEWQRLTVQLNALERDTQKLADRILFLPI